MRHLRASVANSSSDILSSSVEVRRSSLTDHDGGGGTGTALGICFCGNGGLRLALDVEDLHLQKQDIVRESRVRDGLVVAVNNMVM